MKDRLPHLPDYSLRTRGRQKKEKDDTPGKSAGQIDLPLSIALPEKQFEPGPCRLRDARYASVSRSGAPHQPVRVRRPDRRSGGTPKDRSSAAEAQVSSPSGDQSTRAR